MGEFIEIGSGTILELLSGSVPLHWEFSLYCSPRPMMTIPMAVVVAV